MPVYVYRCSECGHECEYFQHYTDDPVTVCPECKQVSLQKVWQPTAVVFRGDGWYTTDSRIKNGENVT